MGPSSTKPGGGLPLSAHGTFYLSARDRAVRAFLWGTVAIGLVASGALVLVSPHRQAATATPIVTLPQAAPVAPAATVAPPVVAPTPTTVALPAEPDAPVDVPADPYAPEPVRRIGTIEIPKLGLADPMFDGITLNNIDHGPSHWPGTALPGEDGNVVVAGHRVTHTHPFLHIDKLTAGDDVIFTVGGRRSVYVVTGSQIVRPTETFIVNPTSTPTATLFACHPPHSATYRYVVHLVLAQTARS